MISNILTIIGIFSILVAITYIFVDDKVILKGGAFNANALFEKLKENVQEGKITDGDTIISLYKKVKNRLEHEPESEKELQNISRKLAAVVSAQEESHRNEGPISAKRVLQVMEAVDKPSTMVTDSSVGLGTLQSMGQFLESNDHYQRYWMLLAQELQTSTAKREITGSAQTLLKTLADKKVDYNKIMQGYLETRRVMEDPEVMEGTVNLVTKLYGEVINYKSTGMVLNAIMPQIGLVMELVQELQPKVMSIAMGINQNFQKEIGSGSLDSEESHRRRIKRTPSPRCDRRRKRINREIDWR